MPTTRTRRLSPTGLLVPAVMLAVTACGCGKSAPTVDGTVLVGDLPLQDGSIDFFPIEGTLGGTTGASIENGKFEVSEGLTEGKYQIRVQGTRDDPNDMIRAPFSEEMIPKPVQLVPEEYRSQDSPLIRTVEAGHQTFDIEVPEISE